MKYGKKILAVVLLLLLGTGMLTAAAGSRTGDAQVRTERDLQLQSVTMEEMCIRDRVKHSAAELSYYMGHTFQKNC